MGAPDESVTTAGHLALLSLPLGDAVATAPEAVVTAAPAAARLEQVTQMYRDHARYVFRVLHALGVREADRADAVHDVFVTVHRRLGEVSLFSSSRAWVRGIAVRVAANHRRRASNAREDLYAEVPEPSVQSPASDDARDLLKVLGALDDDQRAVFVLYEIEGLTMPEVAEALGCPATTAYSRLYAARRSIRARYADDGVNGGRR